MDEHMHYVQVHRFGEAIAVYIGGETVYMSPSDADDLAHALRDAAKDVRSRMFGESAFPTWRADVLDLKAIGKA